MQLLMSDPSPASPELRFQTRLLLETALASSLQDGRRGSKETKWQQAVPGT
jgi:hypothetical protein